MWPASLLRYPTAPAPHSPPLIVCPSSDATIARQPRPQACTCTCTCAQPQHLHTNWTCRWWTCRRSWRTRVWLPAWLSVCVNWDYPWACRCGPRRGALRGCARVARVCMVVMWHGIVCAGFAAHRACVRWSCDVLRMNSEMWLLKWVSAE